MGDNVGIRVIDVDQWNRKEQFHFFLNYDNPFFGLTVNVDVTTLLQFTRDKGYSFFAAYLFISQFVANSIPEFRYRLKDGQVLDFPEIAAGSTILKSNKVFTFCYFDYMQSFPVFEQHALEQIKKCSQPESRLDDHDYNLAQIHYSVLPWVHFTGLTHPRNYGIEDSIPKIVFGKYTKEAGKVILPISVEAHHSLMDGFHVGQYFEGFQNCANFPDKYLKG